jgi:hypothetical protein
MIKSLGTWGVRGLPSDRHDTLVPELSLSCIEAVDRRKYV